MGDDKKFLSCSMERIPVLSCPVLSSLILLRLILSNQILTLALTLVKLNNTKPNKINDSVVSSFFDLGGDSLKAGQVT